MQSIYKVNEVAYIFHSSGLPQSPLENQLSGDHSLIMQYHLFGVNLFRQILPTVRKYQSFKDSNLVKVNKNVTIVSFTDPLFDQ